MLACSIAFECFEAIARRNPHVIQRFRRRKLVKLALGDRSKGAPLADRKALENRFGFPVFKTSDHTSRLYRGALNVKRLNLRGFDRDRGSGCPPSPPTPPYIRVRIRRFGKLSP